MFFEDLPEMVLVLGLLLASSEEDVVFTSGPNKENISFSFSFSRLDMLTCTMLLLSVSYLFCDTFCAIILVITG